MPSSMKDFGIDRLGIDERLALVEEIWESIADELERSAASGEGPGRAEGRRAADRSDPARVIPWADVQAMIRSRLARRG